VILVWECLKILAAQSGLRPDNRPVKRRVFAYSWKCAQFRWRNRHIITHGESRGTKLPEITFVSLVKEKRGGYRSGAGHRVATVMANSDDGAAEPDESLQFNY
jgi:hypothetical protein